MKYVNSDKWLAQEVSSRLLMTSITFMSFDKEFIKVFKVKKRNSTNMTFTVENTKRMYINKLIYFLFDSNSV